MWKIAGEFIMLHENIMLVHRCIEIHDPATDPQYWWRRSQLAGLNCSVNSDGKCRKLPKLSIGKKEHHQISSKVENPTETTIISISSFGNLGHSQFQIQKLTRGAEASRSVVASPHKIQKPRSGSQDISRQGALIVSKEQEPTVVPFLVGKREHVCTCYPETCTWACKNGEVSYDREAELEPKPQVKGSWKLLSFSVKHRKSALTQFVWCCLVPCRHPRNKVNVWCHHAFAPFLIATSSHP